MRASAVLPSPAVAPENAGAAVRIQDVSMRFGEREVLHSVSLDIRPGEAIAIVGRSGCGKSTLLRLLSGLEAPAEGEIRIGRASLRGINRSACVMFQDSTLLPWKRVGANVELALLRRRDRGLRAREALDHVGLADRIDEWPAKLSGGQRQRVALARALAAHRELLLLDEPLSALDALTRFDMQNLIERLWMELGFTLVLVTHDIEEALAIADRVLVMENGRWIAEIPVDLPRTRDRSAVPFNRLKARLARLLMKGGADAAMP